MCVCRRVCVCVYRCICVCVQPSPAVLLRAPAPLPVSQCFCRELGARAVCRVPLGTVRQIPGPQEAARISALIGCLQPLEGHTSHRHTESERLRTPHRSFSKAIRQKQSHRREVCHRLARESERGQRSL